jgi:hypothetical protein
VAIRSGARLVNVGHGNVVVAEQIVAIVALDSLPVKRMIESAKGTEPATLAQRLTSERGAAGD